MTKVLLWLAKKIGRRHEWNGPKLYGIGYELGGKIYYARSERPHTNPPNAHTWVPSPLGHGNKMCAACFVTDLEAVVLDIEDHCEPATPPVGGRDLVKIEPKPEPVVLPARLDCPCCHGKTFLMVYNEEFPEDAPQRSKCIHCDGRGWVKS